MYGKLNDIVLSYVVMIVDDKVGLTSLYHILDISGKSYVRTVGTCNFSIIVATVIVIINYFSIYRNGRNVPWIKLMNTYDNTLFLQARICK